MSDANAPADPIRLDWEEMEDLVGLPCDLRTDGCEVLIEVYHLHAIVSAHGPVGDYMRGIAARLRALPHAVSAKAKGSTIRLVFDRPVELG